MDKAKVSSELKKNTHVEHIWRESQACHIKIKITQDRPTFLCQYVAYYRAVLDIFFFCHTILLHCSRIRIDLFPVITFSLQAGHTHTHTHKTFWRYKTSSIWLLLYVSIRIYSKERKNVHTRRVRACSLLTIPINTLYNIIVVEKSNVRNIREIHAKYFQTKFIRQRV